MDTNQVQRMGYSDKITDPAYQVQDTPKDSKQTLKYLLFVVPLLVFVILWYAKIITTWVFVLLFAVAAIAALPPILKERREAEDKTYDGELASIVRREPVAAADLRKVDPKVQKKMVFYTIRIKDEGGKVHTYECTGNIFEDYSDYYTDGERVRHHRGFSLPEKYDKTGNETIACIACGRMNSMDSRRCADCGVVLLK